jgi:hypothetical protein
MGYRYTMRDLEGLVDRLNRTTGAESEPYRDATEAEKAAGFGGVGNVGTYHLMGAYGGHKLVQITSHGGGVRDVLGTGYVSKRELYRAVSAYLDGIDAAATDSHYSVDALQARAGTIERAMQESLDRREKFRRKDEARNAEAVKV